MSSPLPDLLDPWRAARERSDFVGHLPLSSLPRVRALLHTVGGVAEYRLMFSSDNQRRAVIRCEVAAVLTLRCQRCLEALDYPVRASTLLAVVSGTDEARELPERYDPLVVGDMLIRPRDLVEDEILLALPQIAMHEPTVCAMPISKKAGVEQSQAARPFAGLAKLKPSE